MHVDFEKQKKLEREFINSINSLGIDNDLNVPDWLLAAILIQHFRAMVEQLNQVNNYIEEVEQ